MTSQLRRARKTSRFARPSGGDSEVLGFGSGRDEGSQRADDDATEAPAASPVSPGMGLVVEVGLPLRSAPPPSPDKEMLPPLPPSPHKVPLPPLPLPAALCTSAKVAPAMPPAQAVLGSKVCHGSPRLATAELQASPLSPSSAPELAQPAGPKRASRGCFGMLVASFGWARLRYGRRRD